MLNIDGALRLAEAFKTDAASKLAAGAWPIGAKISAGTLPTPSSTINGQTFNWSRMVTYWPKTGVSASYTVPSSFSETSAPNGSLLTGGVRPATALAGISSKSGSTGVQLPSATMAG